MTRRPVLSAVVATIALAATALLATASPAGAAPGDPVTFTVDATEAHPGDTVTVTATFADPDATDVAFSYLSISPNFVTWNAGTKYSFTSCTGQITWCSYLPINNAGVAVQLQAPIPAGQSRTATFTYDIAADSPCGPTQVASFFFYTYRETSAGGTERVVQGPVTNVVC